MCENCAYLQKEMEMWRDNYYMALEKLLPYLAKEKVDNEAKKEGGVDG